MWCSGALTRHWVRFSHPEADDPRIFWRPFLWQPVSQHACVPGIWRTLWAFPCIRYICSPVLRTFWPVLGGVARLWSFEKGELGPFRPLRDWWVGVWGGSGRRFMGPLEDSGDYHVVHGLQVEWDPGLTRGEWWLFKVSKCRFCICLRHPKFLDFFLSKMYSNLPWKLQSEFVLQVSKQSRWPVPIHSIKYYSQGCSNPVIAPIHYGGQMGPEVGLYVLY